MNRARLWTKEFVISTVINFLVALNFFLFMIMISEFAMTKFDASTSRAGVVASIFVIGSLTARVLVGKWMMKYGYKRMLCIGVVAGLVMTLAYWLVNSIVLLICIRYIHGIAFGIATTATATIVSDIIPRERRGEGIGYYSLSQILATAIGPFIGIYFSRQGSYSMIFIACAIVSLASCSMLPLLSFENKVFDDKHLDKMKGFKISNFIEPKAAKIAILALFVFLCYSSVISFLTVYSKEINLTEAASYFFIVYAIVVFASRPIVGRVFDYKGENVIMYPAIIIYGIGMLLFSNSYHGIVLLLSASLIGLGIGAVGSCAQTIAVKVTPIERLGLANSTYYVFTDIGVGIGPMVAGLLIPCIGYRGVYNAFAVVIFLCFVLYYFLHGKTLNNWKLKDNEEI